jgi:hypothetical protein
VPEVDGRRASGCVDRERPLIDRRAPVPDAEGVALEVEVMAEATGW